MPRPRPEPTVAAGTRRNLDDRSVRPSPPAAGPPPSGRPCPQSSVCQGFSSHRHGVSVSPQPLPVAENRTPPTADSRSCTGCSSDPRRTPRWSPRPPPARPDWPSPADRPPIPPTSKYQTTYLTASARPCDSSRKPLLPVDRTNTPQMTRPLGSTPTAPSRGFTATTSRSVGTPRDGTHCLTGTTD